MSDPLDTLDTTTIQTGSKSKPSYANEDVLANMQKLYNEKKAKSEGFLESMKDASAWMTPGLQGPSEALYKRDVVKQQQEKDLQDLATQIGSQKAQLALQQNMQKAAFGDGSAGVGAGAGGVGAGGIRSIIQSLPPEQQQAANILLQSGRPDAIDEIMKMSKEFGLKKPDDIKKYEYIMAQPEPARSMLMRQHFPLTFEPNKEIVTEGPQTGETIIKPSYQQQNPPQTNVVSPVAPPPPPSRTLAPVTPPALPTGVSSGPGPRVNPQTGRTEQHAGYDIPLAANTPVTAKTHQLLTPVMGGKVMEVTPTDSSGGFGNTAVIRGMDGKYYRLAHFNKVNVGVGDTITPETIIGAAGNTGNSRGNHLHIEEIKAKQSSEPTELRTVESKEREKQFTDAQLKEAGVETGKRRAALEKSRSEISDNKRDALTILNILDKSPKSVGLTYGNPLTGTLSEGIKFVTGKDIEPLLERQMLTPEEINNRKEFQSSAKKLSLAYRSSVFKGTGAVSDMETKAADEATGLQKENPAEANKYFAILYAENYRAHEKLINAWGDYQKNNGGSKADFGQFERTDGYKNIFKEKEERLERHFPELSSSGIGFGEKKQNTGPSETELKNWKNRYGPK
jgi:hypothetical protein